MILYIHLSNFFSIKEEITLDLRAANINTKKAKALKDNVFRFNEDEILKTVALYGANASGKSNIIKAIRFCSRMIFESHLHNENTVYNFIPFKFEGYKNKPSTFLIRFICEGIEYEYSYSLTRTEILVEKLFYYPNGRKAKVFVRDERIPGTKKDKYSFGNAIKRPLDVAENTSNKTLYLSRASQMDRVIGKALFNYFATTFILGYSGFNAIAVEKLLKENKEAILEGLKIADSDIVNIKFKLEEVIVKKLNATFPDNTATITDAKEEQLKITTYHKSAPDVPFDFETEESSGTKKLFFILLTILDVVRNNKILLIDEIESSLHTNIIEYIIKLFNSGKNAQLIYSTHNTRLLDLDKLRKDQIYFVNKGKDASSDLYSLFDYKDFRETMDVEKAYLQGRFDAISFIDDSVSNLKSLING